MLRCLLVSTLVAGSAIVLSAPRVKAQTVNMPFTGTIATGCTFGTPTTGTLIPTPDVNPTSLSSSSTGGTESTVSINCATPANMTISAPIQTSGPTFTPTDCTAEFTTPSGPRGGPGLGFQSCVGTSEPTPVRGSQTLLVDMAVNNPAGIPSGTYGYNVTLTIVP